MKMPRLVPALSQWPGLYIVTLICWCMVIAVPFAIALGLPEPVLMGAALSLAVGGVAGGYTVVVTLRTSRALTVGLAGQLIGAAAGISIAYAVGQGLLRSL